MRQNALRSSIKSLNAETLRYPIKHRAHHIDQMPGRMSMDKSAHGNPPIIANDRMRPTYSKYLTVVCLASRLNKTKNLVGWLGTPFWRDFLLQKNNRYLRVVWLVLGWVVPPRWNEVRVWALNNNNTWLTKQKVLLMETKTTFFFRLDRIKLTC